MQVYRINSFCWFSVHECFLAIKGIFHESHQGPDRCHLQKQCKPSWQYKGRANTGTQAKWGWTQGPWTKGVMIFFNYIYDFVSITLCTCMRAYACARVWVCMRVCECMLELVSSPLYLSWELNVGHWPWQPAPLLSEHSVSLAWKLTFCLHTLKMLNFRMQTPSSGGSAYPDASPRWQSWVRLIFP